MKKLQLIKTSLVVVLLAPFPVFADGQEQSEPEYSPVPEPPTLPDPVASGEALEPEVEIRPGRDGGTVTEYRVGGQLYKVKITPAVGPSYYLIDFNGDGELDCKINNLYDDECVPQWTLFSW